jgi:hypothetical protein
MEDKLLELIGANNDAQLLKEEINKLKEKWNKLEPPLNDDCKKRDEKLFNKYIYLFEFLWLNNFKEIGKCYKKMIKERWRKFYTDRKKGKELDVIKWINIWKSEATSTEGATIEEHALNSINAGGYKLSDQIKEHEISVGSKYKPNKDEILSGIVNDIKPRYLFAWAIDIETHPNPLSDIRIMKKTREFLYKKLVRKRKKWGLYWKEKTYLWNATYGYPEDLKRVMRYEIKINPNYNIYQYD